MGLVKTIKTTKFISYNRTFLLSLLPDSSLILTVVPLLRKAASTASAVIARRSFFFFELSISEFALELGC